MSDFGETREVVGRKDYRCIWCGGPIPKGEKHKHYSGMWDGDWQNWRMHEECYGYSSQDPDIHLDGFMPYEAPMPERVKKLQEKAAVEGDTLNGRDKRDRKVTVVTL